MKKSFLPMIAFFLLVGCDAEPIRTHDIYFKANIEIPYKEDVNACEYIVTVDDTSIKSSMIEEDTIYVSNFSVKCPSEVETDEIGEITLSYEIGDEVYETTATVKDLTEPNIKIKDFKATGNTTFTFEESELSDIDTLYSVSDNVDKEKDIKVKIKGDYDLSKAGTYTITITATDQSDNQATRDIVITIKEKPKEETATESNVPSSSTNSSNSGSSTSGNTGNNNSSGSSSSGNSNNQSTTPSLPAGTQDFLFSAGYNMATAPSACQQVLLSSGRSGNCTAIYGSDGIPIGMRLTLY